MIEIDDVKRLQFLYERRLFACQKRANNIRELLPLSPPETGGEVHCLFLCHMLFPLGTIHLKPFHPFIVSNFYDHLRRRKVRNEEPLWETSAMKG